MSAVLVPSDWSALRSMSRMQLSALGCRLWDDSGLMLFPVAWYDSIPDGFIVTKINGDRVPFSKAFTDRDQRFGALAFGVVAAS